MKLATVLLIIGLILGLVVPYCIQDIVTGAGIQLPQFFSSKTPPRNFNFSIPIVSRIVGMIFVALAIVRFILVRGRNTN